MTEEARIIVRKGKPEDTDFITNSWVTGQYYGDWHYSQMPKEAFFLAFKGLIERLLKDPATQVAVACLEDDPDMIMAYNVVSGNTINWAYTKVDYRGKGLQNLLLGQKVINQVSSVTKPGAAIMKNKKWTFNPLKGI